MSTTLRVNKATSKYFGSATDRASERTSVAMRAASLCSSDTKGFMRGSAHTAAPPPALSRSESHSWNASAMRASSRCRDPCRLKSAVPLGSPAGAATEPSDTALSRPPMSSWHASTCALCTAAPKRVIDGSFAVGTGRESQSFMVSAETVTLREMSSAAA